MQNVELNSVIKLIESHQFDRAEAHLKRALSAENKSIDVLNLLGWNYTCQKRLFDAKEVFETAVGIDASHFKSRFNLSLTLVQMKLFHDALNSFFICQKLKPDQPEVLSSLGNLNRIIGNLKEAEKFLSRAVLIAPNNPLIAENRAWLCLDQKRYTVALKLFKSLSMSFPNRLELNLGVARALIELNKLDEAQVVLQQILKIDPKFIAAINLMAAVLNKQGQSKAGNELLEQALKLFPDNTETHIALALSHIDVGDKNSAARHLLRIIELGSDWYPAYFHLVYTCNRRLSTEQTNTLSTIIKENKSYWLHFALAKDSEHKLDFETSTNQLKIARKLYSEQTKEVYKPRPINDLINYSKTEITLNGLESNQYKMIFVTGLPRTGTTLVDQILDCHPDVTSIAESGMIGGIAQRVQELTQLPYYQGIHKITAEQKVKLVDDALSRFKLKSLNIVDTTPNNVFYIGFILALFPNAKIIINRRSPLDTCLSIYQHPLKGQPYANKISDLVSHFLETQRLIEHWSTNFPGSVLKVHYELLANNPQSEITKLLSSLALPFSDACFYPEKNSRNVLTPSSTSVRQKVNNHAIARWQNFVPYFSELFAPLMDCERQHAQFISLPEKG